MINFYSLLCLCVCVWGGVIAESMDDKILFLVVCVWGGVIAESRDDKLLFLVVSVCVCVGGG